MRGDTFTDKGKFMGKWNSEAVGIQVSDKTIQYFWKATLPGKKAGLKSKGFGEFVFEVNNDIFNLGSGEFMNTHMTDQLISNWKSVSLRRITKKKDIKKMIKGKKKVRKKLVKQTLYNW